MEENSVIVGSANVSLRPFNGSPVSDKRVFAVFKEVFDRVENVWSSPYHEMQNAEDFLGIRNVFGRNQVFVSS